jgi:hypothetical protein
MRRWWWPWSKAEPDPAPLEKVRERSKAARRSALAELMEEARKIGDISIERDLSETLTPPKGKKP